VLSSAGALIASYAYDAYGALKLRQGVIKSVRAPLYTPLLYAGQYTDAETGFQYLQARYYDPATQQFLTMDPQVAQTKQPYAYTGANPVNGTDPTGLCTFPQVTSPLDPYECVGYPTSLFLQVALAHPDQAQQVARFAETANADTERWLLTTRAGRLVNSLVVEPVCILADPNASDAEKLLAAGQLALLIPGAGNVVDGAADFILRPILRPILRRILSGVGKAVLKHADRIGTRGDPVLCEGCFAAGTLVATPQGERAIQTLRVGQQVLSEDPKTHTVEAETVQRVIHDPASPLLSVDLSDGSTITTTLTHSFWVDAGARIAPGGAWLWATHLRYGDELRTASGQVVSVVRVRRGVGYADVWTLTVARDHTFFVGSARVLVHNTDIPCNGGLGPLVPVESNDPATIKLAQRIGGVPSVRFTNDPAVREFDAVSDQYIAQAKPANFTLNKNFRTQAKATFEAAIRSGRRPYFQFDGPPGPGVIEAIQRYETRYEVTAVIDLGPL